MNAETSVQDCILSFRKTYVLHIPITSQNGGITMKKIMTMILLSVFVFSYSVAAFAMENSDVNFKEEFEEKTISFEPVSELEMYFDLIESTDSELKERGLTTTEIKELKEINIEEAFLEQAKLPEEVLLKYGYTDEQVELIKNYDGSPITRESKMFKASATISAGITLNTYGEDEYKFTYSWVWSGKPFNNGKDIVAMRWATYNSNANAVASTIRTKSSNVEYYDFYGDFYSSTSPSISSEEDSIYFTFPLEKKNDLGSEYVWAKEGYIKATVKKVASSLHYIRIRGSYGKSTTSIIPGITIGKEGVSFTFSPSTEVTMKGKDQAFFNKYGDYIGE